jgi:hypothetical protein
LETYALRSGSQGLSAARIVDSACVLSNRYGFEAVTIDDVMKRAGLPRRAFYNHAVSDRPWVSSPYTIGPRA